MKKFFAVAVATVMTLSTALTAFAAETKYDKATLTVPSCTEVENPLKGKNAEKVTITYTINFAEDAAKNGWDGVFSFFDADTTGRVSFQTAPYICYNAGTGGTDKYIDIKADAWCTANCEAGKDYTFQYVITKDAITVTCDGETIAAFTETGRGAGAAATGYQDILDALNTYPTLTIGVGEGVTSYWWTEKCEMTLTIDDGIAAAGDTQVVTPGTGDMTAVLPVAVLAVAAMAVVVVMKKKSVTE